MKTTKIDPARCDHPTYSEEQLVRALRKLEKNWPPTHALFDRSGRLTLIRLDSDGSFPSPGVAGAIGDSTVDDYPGITSDGGDAD